MAAYYLKISILAFNFFMLAFFYIAKPVQSNRAFLTPGIPSLCCNDHNIWCLQVYPDCGIFTPTPTANLTVTNISYSVYAAYTVPQGFDFNIDDWPHDPTGNGTTQQGRRSSMGGPPTSSVEFSGYMVNPMIQQTWDLGAQFFPNLLVQEILEAECTPVGCDADFPATLNSSSYPGYSATCYCTYPHSTFQYLLAGLSTQRLLLVDPIPVLNSTLGIIVLLPTPVQTWGNGTVPPVQYIDSEDYSPLAQSYGRRNSDSSDPYCSVSYIIDWPKSNNVTVYNRSPPPYNWAVAVRVGDYYRLFDCSQFICYLVLPSSAFYNQGYLYLDVYDPPNICASFVVYVPGEKLCAPSTCVITCLPTAIKYYRCQPTDVQAQLWLMLVLLIVIVVYFWWVFVFLTFHTVKFIIRLPSGLYVVVTAVVCSPWMSWLGRKMLDGTHYTIRGIGLVGAWDAIASSQVGSEKVFPASVTVNRPWSKSKVKYTAMEEANPDNELVGRVRSGGGGKVGWWSSVFILTLIISSTSADILTYNQLQETGVPPQYQCSHTAVIEGTSTQCITQMLENGDPYTECQEIFSAELPAIQLGKTVCLDINKDGVFAGKFYITYAASYAKAVLSSSYYTSDWYMVPHYANKCSGNDQCSSASCGAYKVGHTSSGATVYPVGPDENGNPVAPTADGGIFSAKDGGFQGPQACEIREARQILFTGECEGHDNVCMYAYCQLIPSGPVWQVLDIIEVDLIPVIEVLYVDDAFQNAFEESFTMTGPQSVSTNGYTINFLGTLQNTADTVFGTNKVVISTRYGDAYLSPASPFGTPTAGAMGDVQFSTPQLPTGRNYNYANTIAGISGVTALSCTTDTRHGIGTFLSVGNGFPMIIGNNLWAYDGASLISNLTNAGAAVFSIVTVGSGVTVTTYASRVCPDLNLINATGCYNCNAGSQLLIQITTRCDSGWVFITVLDDLSIVLGTPTLFLFSGTLIDWLVPFTTDKAENTFTVKVCDETGAYCDSDRVDFIAFEYTKNDTGYNILNGTVEYIDAGTLGGSGTGWFTDWIGNVWEDVFTGIATPGAIIAFVVEAIIFIILAVIIVKVLAWVYDRSQKDKAQMGMDNWVRMMYPSYKGSGKVV